MRDNIHTVERDRALLAGAVSAVAERANCTGCGRRVRRRREGARRWVYMAWELGGEIGDGWVCGDCVVEENEK